MRGTRFSSNIIGEVNNKEKTLKHLLQKIDSTSAKGISSSISITDLQPFKKNHSQSEAAGQNNTLSGSGKNKNKTQITFPIRNLTIIK